MQCKCGSETKLNEAVKGKLNARLVFQECKGCGRVSNGELFVREIKVAQDGGSQATARKLFAILDAEQAEILHAFPGEPQVPSTHVRAKNEVVRTEAAGSGPAEAERPSLVAVMNLRSTILLAIVKHAH
ncbi:hypothetical protein SAMN04488129_108139 [Halomonas daqiaonensis]|uniref:Uncharacterized protein n=1 Tax=Halomonas daqiaonensis TaxID=650850 RepID=A0A1H7NYY1_9GAMM|nr:hypothetical protein SAMN04488129_108139 [Halomonas daqiaonensis]